MKLVAGLMVAVTATVLACGWIAPSAGAAKQRCTIKGDGGADRLVGTKKRDVICGRGGKDVLIGLRGGDVLIGGPGDDVLRGGKGGDTLKAGPGDDRLLGQPQSDTLHGGPGDDYLDGGSGVNFYFTGSGNDRCRDSETDEVTPGCDDTPPSLEELVVTPETVDTSSESRLIEFSMRISDDLSGLRGEPSIQIIHPVTGQRRSPVVERTGGDLMEGTFSGRLRLDHFSAMGKWDFEISFTDRQGNSEYLDAKGLAALGLPTGFEQTGIGDDVRPEIKSIQLDRTSVNTDAGPQTITVQMRVTDDFTGVTVEQYNAVGVNAYSGSGQMLAATGFHRVSGSDLDGTYSGSLVVPRFASPGTWTLSAGAIDRAGNQVILDANQLKGLGLTSGFFQTGAGDTEAPRVVELSVTPSRIDTASGPQTVSIRMRVTDNLAGLSELMGIWGYPSNGGGLGTFLTRVGGSDLDSVYEGSLEIPEGSANGRIVFRPAPSDLVNNIRHYDDKALADLGFANVVTNGPPP